MPFNLRSENQESKFYQIVHVSSSTRREPWSSGYGRQLERSWVRILDGYDIFHIDLLLKLHCLFEKDRNKRKRGRGWRFFVKNVYLQHCYGSLRPYPQTK